MPDEPPGRESITVPADIVELDEQIAQLRQDKETAVDTESFHAAGEIRTEEKRLLAQRTAAVRQWASSIDIVAVVHEAENLREQVRRLRGLLEQRGIKVPGETDPGGIGAELEDCSIGDHDAR